jgi:HD superfamily phosphodiesterase
MNDFLPGLPWCHEKPYYSVISGREGKITFANVMDYTPILEQVQHYVRSLFDTHVNEKLLYHNRYHTEQVAEKAAVIAAHYQLKDPDLFIVQVAAWCHDIGYLTGDAAGHILRERMENWR